MMGVFKYSYDWSFMDEKDEFYWYFLGFISADGYVSDNEIEIGLNEKDLPILELIRDRICKDKPIYAKKKTSSYTLKLSGRKQCKEIKEVLGMRTNKKQSEIRFPIIPTHMQKHFVRGYFDGDGTVGPTKGQQIVNGEKKYYSGIRIRILGNEPFLMELLEVVRLHVPNQTRKLSKRSDCLYEITYNFSTAESVMRWMYQENTVSIERKIERWREISSHEDIV